MASGIEFAPARAMSGPGVGLALRESPDPVAIVGGGISGLAAAYELARLGIPFVLYERAHAFGGLIRTERVGGYTIDAGPDAVLTHKPAAVALCSAIGLGHRLQPQASRATFVVRGQRLRQLPEASVFGLPTRWMPFVRSDALSLPARLRMAADLWLPSSSGTADESIASFIGRRFGRDAVEYLAEPLLAGIHGGDPERLSMRSAFPRLMELEARHRSVILGLQRESMAARREKGSTAPPFVALTGGMRELTDALVSQLPATALRKGAGVDDIQREADGFVVRLSDGSCTRAAAVVLATPPPVATRLTRALDLELSLCCASIRMAPVVTIALGYPRSAVAHPLNGTGFVTPRSEGMSVRAVSWVSSKWRNRAPSGAVLLRAVLGGMLQPDVIDVDDQTLVDRASSDCARLLGIRGLPELVRVYRWPHATPQLEVGHSELIQRIESCLAARPGLFLTASGFRGTGIADCVADARHQAARAAAFVVRRRADHIDPHSVAV
jgi:oxygen-dependent protoporphyrinogen oxidase